MTRPEIPGTRTSYVAVEGVRFHLTRAQPARKRRTTPVLLLHGIPETAVAWRHLIPELARDRVVLAPDLKGLGDSEAREPYDVPTLASELAALVLHEVDGPVDVVGHDWGGPIGLALAGQRPDLVRRVVDLSGPYRQLDLTRAVHVPLFALPLLPEAAFAVAGEQIWRAALSRGWRRGEPPAEIADHYVAAYAPQGRVTAAMSYYRATTRARVWQAVAGGRPAGSPRPRPECALVVWGADDPYCSVSDGEAVVRDLGASTEMLTLPGVGHFPVEEAHDVVVPAVAEFLRS